MRQRTNEEWLHELASTGQEQAVAIADLRTYLLRAALYTFSRHRSDLGQRTYDEIEPLAEDCAQEALVAILKHLHEFRGDSQFTTWAYKFAVNLALVTARHERWKSVSLDQLLDETEVTDWPIRDKSTAVDPDRPALREEVWTALRDTINHDLTDRQRQVLKAMVFDDVPMDEVVRHLGTNRNAVYKLLHDARRRLKARLEARGFDAAEMIGLFSAQQ